MPTYKLRKEDAHVAGREDIAIPKISKNKPNINKTVMAQYEAVRRSGLTNMFDVNTVQRIAFDNDYSELVCYIEDKHYTGILRNYSEWMRLVEEKDIPVIEVENNE